MNAHCEVARHFATTRYRQPDVVCEVAIGLREAIPNVLREDGRLAARVRRRDEASRV
jgi:hypothetical protein